MLTKKNLIIICLSLFLVTTISAQKTFKYIGADKCKLCHNKPAKGEQYNWWKGDVHSHAMETLSNQQSLDVAKKLGIDDPTTDDRCLRCHSTYHMVDANLHGGINDSEGITCEGCHGPGSNYKSPMIMKNRKMAVASGLILQTEEVCIACHNTDSPTFKGFDFEDALTQIDHSDPSKE